jgi:hypothetical protein
MARIRKARESQARETVSASVAKCCIPEVSTIEARKWSLLPSKSLKSRWQGRKLSKVSAWARFGSLTIEGNAREADSVPTRNSRWHRRYSATSHGMGVCLGAELPLPWGFVPRSPQAISWCQNTSSPESGLERILETPSACGLFSQRDSFSSQTEARESHCETIARNSRPAGNRCATRAAWILILRHYPGSENLTAKTENM